MVSIGLLVLQPVITIAGMTSPMVTVSLWQWVQVVTTS
jgi:hypothetical protein